MTQPLSMLSGPTVIPPALSGNINGVLINGSAADLLTANSINNSLSSLTTGSTGMSAISSLLTPSTGLATTSTTGGVPLTGVTATSSTAATAGLTNTTATTPTTAPAIGSAAANTQGVNLTDLIKMVATTLLMVLQTIAKEPAAGATAATPATNTATMAKTGAGLSATPVSTALPANDVSAALDRLIVGGSATQKAQLKQNLIAISQDPEGAKLVADSIRKGVTFNVGNPAAAGANDVGEAVNCPVCAASAADKGNNAQFAATGTSGNVVINGVTVTKSNGSSDITVANPNKLDTIVHEMIHATTTADGNSQQEEATAKFIGARVANRLAPGTAPTSDFNTTLQNTIPLYTGLNRSNNINQSLAALGLSV